MIEERVCLLPGVEAAFSSSSPADGVPADWVTLGQPSGCAVCLATDPEERRDVADAAVCATPGLTLAIRTADCVPILIAAPHCVAAVHSGWRGTAANIVGRTVDIMRRLGGGSGGDLVAAIGPHIRAEHYAFGPRFLDQVDPRFVLQSSDGSTRLDLTAYVTRQLADAGVHVVYTSPTDTFVDPLWPSARRDGTRERAWATIRF